MKKSEELSRSERKRRMKTLLSKSKILKQELLNQSMENDLIQSKRPYTNIKLVNKILTVVMQDGSIVSKEDSSIEEYKNVMNCNTAEQIVDLIYTKKHKDKQEEKKKSEYLRKGLDYLIQIGEIEERDNSLYFKGINRSIPELLAKKLGVLAQSLLVLHDENLSISMLTRNKDYLALKRFFIWTCLNPRAEVADMLYDFLVRNSMKITRQGLFVALRNVVTVSTKPELIKFISHVYHKVKLGWKKNPSKYTVYKKLEGEYGVTEKSVSDKKDSFGIGNLQELYNNLSNMEENRYTDNYTKTFDIRIGKLVSMKPEECSWSTKDCAEAGLHFAGNTNPYVLCGDTTVLVLINPMKVVGIGTEKGRCYEYLPFMITTTDEANEIMKNESFDFTRLDEKYAIEELSKLKTKAKNGFAKEAKKHEFNIPTISSSELNHIVDYMKQMSEKIKNRVVDIE
jgi:hypothetical protein